MVAPLVVRFQSPNSGTWRSLLAAYFAPVFPADPSDGYYVCVDSRLWHKEVDHSPVARRGWVAQERYLSKRILFCGVTQLFFACAESRACESYPLGCPPSMKAEDVFTEGRAMLAKLHMLTQDRHNKIMEVSKQEAADWEKGNYSGRITETSVVGSSPLAQILRIWGGLVQSYSTLELTQFTDKLPALSGIAQRFAPYLEPSLQYCAGLWLSTRYNVITADLVTLQLAWCTKQPAPRPQECTAPTWSWASVNSTIYDAVEMPELENPFAPRIYSLACLCNPIMLEFQGYSRYGSVKKGVVHLAGMLLPATLKRDDDDDNPGSLLRVRECYGLDIELDTSDVDLDGPFVCTILQEQLESLQFRRLDGLILRPVMDGSKGRYRRVGMFWTHEEEEWEALKKPITDVEAEAMWCEERRKGFRSPEMDSYSFSIE